MMTSLSTLGQLLKAWRNARRISQQELAFRSGLSAKHISFLETGRADPSKEVILAICSVLDIPLREVNILLTAAGLPISYGDSPPDSKALEPVREAIRCVLDKHLPYPAWVVDGKCEVIMLNASFAAMNRLIAAELPGFPTKDPMFHPLGLRRCIVNWPDIVTLMLRRMHHKVLLGRKTTQETLERVIQYPGIPLDWRHHSPSLSTEPTVCFRVKLKKLELSFMTTLTTFNGAMDNYVEEITIESCFPTNEPTKRFCEELLQGHWSADTNVRPPHVL